MQAPIFRTSWTSFRLVALNRALEWRDLAPLGPPSKRKTPLPRGTDVACMGPLFVIVAWNESVVYVSSPQGGCGALGVGTKGVLGAGGGDPSVPLISAIGRLVAATAAATAAALAVAVAASAAAAASSPSISGSRNAGCMRAAAATAMEIFADSDSASSARNISCRRSSAVGARSISSAGGASG